MFRLVLVFIFAVAITNSYGKSINLLSPSMEGRIVGGVYTTIEKHPYQISLQLNGNDHQCGGSLIRPNVVLTAAHCLEFGLENYSVRAGSNTTVHGGQVAQVTQACSHPKYHTDLTDYDVAVLKLNKHLNLNSAVQLINLLNVGEEVQRNTMATVTGWGLTEVDGNETTENLRKVEVPKIDQMECQQMFWPFSITDRMTCYGYAEGGKDSCQADSGGPLVVKGKQVGIVSWGIGCGFPDLPGVYTRLENEEIHHHINNCLAKFE